MQGQIEKAWTQIGDALHQMARAQFQRTTSTVPAEIKDATPKTWSSPPSTILPRGAGGDVFDGLIVGFGMDNLGFRA